jgi:hypothetical protein
VLRLCVELISALRARRAAAETCCRNDAGYYSKGFSAHFSSDEYAFVVPSSIVAWDETASSCGTR